MGIIATYVSQNQKAVLRTFIIVFGAQPDSSRREVQINPTLMHLNHARGGTNDPLDKDLISLIRSFAKSSRAGRSLSLGIGVRNQKPTTRRSPGRRWGH